MPALKCLIPVWLIFFPYKSSILIYCKHFCNHKWALVHVQSKVTSGRKEGGLRLILGLLPGDDLGPFVFVQTSLLIMKQVMAGTLGIEPGNYRAKSLN